MKYYPLNEYQKSILNIHLAHPDCGICNLGGVLLYDSDVSFEIASEIIAELIRINPILSVRLSRNKELYLNTLSQPRLYKLDLTHLSSDAADKEIDTIMSVPFSLYDSPLSDFRYLNLPNGKKGILWKLHGLISDRFSFIVLQNHHDLIFDSIKTSVPHALVPDYSYLNAALSPAPSYSTALGYFQNQLAGFELASYAKNEGSCPAKEYLFEVDRRDSDYLTAFCNDNAISKTVLLYAVLAVYLANVTDSDTVSLGTVCLNRGRTMRNTVGHYSNTLPFIIKVNYSESLLALCTRISRRLKALMRYDDYPYERLIEECRPESRLFEVTVTHIGGKYMSDGKYGKMREYFNGSISEQMCIDLIENAGSDSFKIRYRTDIYSDEYIKTFAKRLVSIARRGVLSPSISAIDIITDEDTKAYKKLNSTEHDYLRTTVSRRFSGFARKNPDHISVIDGDSEYTAKQLDKMSSVIAATLIEKGITSGSVVTLLIDRSIYLQAAILGVMKAGAAYMPLSSSQPIKSLERTVRECDCVLSTEETAFLPSICVDKLDYGQEVPDIDLSDSSAPAYFMKTSGSTGTPKTVIISHNSLLLRLHWMHEKYSLERTVLQKNVSTFDVSGWELLSVAYGAKTVLIPEGTERDTDLLSEHINKHSIEAIHFIPSMLNLFLQSSRSSFESVDIVFSSGETLTSSTLNGFKTVFPNARLVNLYGPTECTIDVTAHEVESFTDRISIGTPAYNTHIYILNRKNKLMPRECRGEIVICGDLVGMGYTDFGGGFCEYNGMPAYKSGDYGYLGFDGNIYILGRTDGQLKVRGIRLDSSESEHIAMNIGSVFFAKTLCTDGKLILYYSAQYEIENIHSILAEEIPAERMPSSIVYLSQIPYTVSGKLDVRKLASMRPDGPDFSAPKTRLEKLICKEILALLAKKDIYYEAIGITDNLYELGVDAHLLTLLSERLEDLGYYPLSGAFAHCQTVHELCSATAAPDLPCIPLNRNKASGSVVVCFPYAGGQIRAFENFAKSDSNTLVVNYSYFSAEKNLESISRHIAETLNDYSEITLVGASIGAAFALKTASILESHGRSVKGVFLLSALPDDEHSIKQFLFVALGLVSRKLFGSMIRKKALRPGTKLSMLVDTNRYYRYMKKGEQLEVDAPVVCVFSDDDTTTAEYRTRYRNWERFIGKLPLRITSQGHGNKFFEHDVELYKKLCMLLGD